MTSCWPRSTEQHRGTDRRAGPRAGRVGPARQPLPALAPRRVVCGSGTGAAAAPCGRITAFWSPAGSMAVARPVSWSSTSPAGPSTPRSTGCRCQPPCTWTGMAGRSSAVSRVLPTSSPERRRIGRPSTGSALTGRGLVSHPTCIVVITPPKVDADARHRRLSATASTTSDWRGRSRTPEALVQALVGDHDDRRLLPGAGGPLHGRV